MMTKHTRNSIILLSAIVLFASCQSTTMIQSSPGEAKVYINDEYKGKTPYMHTDTKIVGSSFTLKLEKDGYKPFITRISRDETIDPGAIAGGIFFAVPFLWTMKYYPVHQYEMTSISPQENTNDETINNSQRITPQRTDSFYSKANKLRELKKLLDEKIITQEEFEKEKAKILALPD